MTIEDLLEDVSDRGWYLYSMYHHPLDRPIAYQWELTLRCPGPPALCAHGQGASLSEALIQAINNIERASPFVMPTFVATNETPLATVMSKLMKPAQPAQPIQRKI